MEKYPAILVEQYGDALRCDCCVRRCVINEGKHGVCGTRVNNNGALYSEIFGMVSSASSDPVEKKPLYHFHPGKTVYSLGSMGCSLKCPGCQNWQISQDTSAVSRLRYLSPADAVNTAISQGDAGICWTYNEPAIWLEYTLESAILAKKAGLFTAYITNGTATREHLDIIGEYLDAYRVDIKAITPDNYHKLTGYNDPAEILINTIYAKKKWGMHVECVTNITPTMNDTPDELSKIAWWISKNLGAETPWHITRFYPQYELQNIPATPLSTIDMAYEIGTDAGLKYIYVGNIPGDKRQDTLCPICKAIIIERYGFSMLNDVSNICECGYKLPIVV
jgi:pyruvate formate lyase activating enzyme